jgi:lipoate-protein ligase A
MLQKPVLHVLRLAAGALPLLDRLCLEEALLRADARNWLVTAHGEPGAPGAAPTIVLGVAGQLERLVHVEAAAARGASVLRRFSGGGTVVVDAGTLFAGFVLNQRDVAPARPLFPRDIMRWSEGVYAPVFAHTFGGGAGGAGAGAQSAAATTAGAHGVATTKEANTPDGALAASGARPSPPVAAQAPAAAIAKATTPFTAASAAAASAAPSFSLREHDYCWGDRKVGGNAQSVSRERWVHHTSFLWDFDERNMQLLRLPERRPDYRRDRAHGDFVAALSRLGGGAGGGATREIFLDALEARMREEWDVRVATLEEALEVVSRPAARERRSNSVVPLPRGAAH